MEVSGEQQFAPAGRGRGGRGRGGRGRGRARAPKADWYLHDDREQDADAGQVEPPQQANNTIAVTINHGSGGRRVVMPAARISGPGKEGWEYKDPEGKVQGPFPPSKILTWLDKKYFSIELEVRKVTLHGASKWSRLAAVLTDIKKEAALSGGSSGGQLPAQLAARLGSSGGGGGRGGGRAAAPAPASYHSPAEPHSNGGTPLGGRGSGGRSGRGGRGRGRGVDEFGAFPESFSSGRGTPGRGERGRGGRGGERSSRGERGRGGRGGRGGRAAQPAGPSKATVTALFTGGVKLGTDQPVWRYIDPEGKMQGPFPASNMLEWHAASYLTDMELPVCGTSRKVSPPNLPTPVYFVPLGRLLDWVAAGNQFVPVDVEDIKSGSVPEFLQQLKGAERQQQQQQQEAQAATKPAASQGVGKAAPAGKQLAGAVQPEVAALVTAAFANALAAAGEPVSVPASTDAAAERAAAAVAADGAAAPVARELVAAAFKSVLSPETEGRQQQEQQQADEEQEHQQDANGTEADAPAAQEQEQEQEQPEHDEGAVAVDA